MSKITKLFVLVYVCVTGTSNLVYSVGGLSISGLPVAVQEVVKHEFAGAEITEVDYDGISVYEIEGKSVDGMKFQLEIGKDGTILEKKINEYVPIIPSTMDEKIVPGVVIDHCHVSTRLYMPTSSIAILPNGDYVVAHDHGCFEHRKAHDVVEVFGSKDKGKTWEKLSETKGRWDTIFYHRQALYLFGPSGKLGDAVIRRSTDGGRTWTEPKDGKSGLLRDDVKYHSAAVPVVVHNGRIWRAFEIGEGEREEWAAVVFCAPEDADLLDADNWQVSEPIYHSPKFHNWIEGNVVVAPDGKLVNILRTNGQGDDKAVIVGISQDGMTLSYDPNKDFIDFPGGGSKFTIRFDDNKQTNPNADRNVLVLTSSADLRNWRVERTVLSHPNRKKIGFHYADWLIEGDDIIFTLRTAYFDGQGGPSNRHDNNYITFHRIKGFRKGL